MASDQSTLPGSNFATPKSVPMSKSNTRLLTGEKSKLGKVDLASMLRQDSAWAILPAQTREHLYSLLPAPQPGEAPHNIEVNPLNTANARYIEEELNRWQDDLKNGLEAKAYREEALQAGKDRVEGKFDECKDVEREEWFGKGGEEENQKPKVEDGGGIADSSGEL